MLLLANTGRVMACWGSSGRSLNFSKSNLKHNQSKSRTECKSTHTDAIVYVASTGFHSNFHASMSVFQISRWQNRLNRNPRNPSAVLHLTERCLAQGDEIHARGRTIVMPSGQL